MVPIKRKFDFSNAASLVTTIKVASKTAIRKAERTAAPETLVKSVVMTVPGTKFRRIKGDINKISRKKRELLPEDRNIINKWWNTNQKLITDAQDPICAAISKQCNDAGYDSKALCPAAVAGRISSLARLGMMTEARRSKVIARQLKYGMYTTAPKFTPELLKDIQVHYAREIADAKLRNEQHILIKKGVKVTPQFTKVPIDDQGRVLVETLRAGKIRTKEYNDFQIQYGTNKKIPATVKATAGTLRDSNGDVDIQYM